MIFFQNMRADYVSVTIIFHYNLFFHRITLSLLLKNFYPYFFDNIFAVSVSKSVTEQNLQASCRYHNSSVCIK